MNELTFGDRFLEQTLSSLILLLGGPLQAALKGPRTPPLVTHTGMEGGRSSHADSGGSGHLCRPINLSLVLSGCLVSVAPHEGPFS